MKYKTKPHNKKNKGQIMVLLAIMLLVLVAIIGLAVDVGYVYVSYARLRRAVDAAALDAANQIKKNYTGDDLENAAVQFLQLNDVVDPSAEVRFCNPDAGYEAWHDPSMCSDPPRKLVAVTASSEVPTFFMSVLGFDTVTISASAESEAASIEVILVIDVSASQAQNPASGDLGHAHADPYWCNRVNLYSAMEGGCLPFENVKNAALSFAKEGVDLEYDRIAIVTFSRFATRELEFTGKTPTKTAEQALDEIEDAIRGLLVEDLLPCSNTLLDSDPTCRIYANPAIGVPDPADEASWSLNFDGLLCPAIALGNPSASHHCRTTNSGAGLLIANEMLLETARPDSTWVVIFLTDGGANIGFTEDGDVICPDAYAATGCTDRLVSPYRDSLDSLYAPDDYARDAMNILFGNQVILFTIGQGDKVSTNPEARDLVEYAQTQPNGASFFGSSETELTAIFKAIANQISTRITR
ncbi:MAG: VWA domain-containing protein [Anaerolineae bacterium]|nr:VWA domain-containing protein [Anaerolineae bacterium]